MELHQNSTNPPNDVNLNIDSIIDMTLRKFIPWTTLATLLNEMTPTLESSKQVIEVLLHTLESLSNKQQSMDIQHTDVPVLENIGIQTSYSEIMIGYEQSQHQDHEDLEIPLRNEENATKNDTFEKSLTVQNPDIGLEDQSNEIPDLSSLNRHERIDTRRKPFNMQ